jgi:hypothetical protein
VIDPISFEVAPGLRLRMSRDGGSPPAFPTDSMSKGLTLEHDGLNLCEEGVGFGLPVLKQGLRAVFPGASRVTLSDPEGRHLRVQYTMNLRERLAPRGSFLNSRPADFLKEIAGQLHRAYPFARGMLNSISGFAYNALGIRTVFEQGRSVGVFLMDYWFDPSKGEIRMALDASGIQRDGVTELILLNEQGASSFIEYSDSEGTRLSARDIGTWVPVTASEASLRSPVHQVRFSVQSIPGARLYRGREVAPGRLAWAGFAYLLPGCAVTFRCSVVVGAGR